MSQHQDPTTQNLTQDQPPGISRRQLIKRGTAVGTAAIWMPPLIQSIRIPAGAQVGSPQPCVGDGRLTGAGFAFISGTSGPKVHYITQGSLHCADDPTDSISVDWTITTGSGPNKVTTNYKFDMTSVLTGACAANPNYPVPTPTANFNEISGTGVGTLMIDNVVQPGDATITYDLIDGGEPGIANDHVTLIISYPGNTLLLNVQNQPLTQGNIQTHGNEALGDGMCVRA